MEFIILAIVLAIACPIILKQKKKPEPKMEAVQTETEQPKEEIKPHDQAVTEIQQETEPSVDYSQSYQAKYLLTRNEWHEYKKLKQYATDKGLQICPKVRLLDIVEPRKGAEHYKSLFYKIQAKHVDFLICDQDLRIKAIVELDDNSHNKADRQERDKFVDQVLTGCGFKVIHTRAVTEETLAGL